MELYNTRTLARVDAVELVLVRNLLPDSVSDYMRLARQVDVPRAYFGADAAEEFATLVRELSPAEQARCHVPIYGLRFLRQNCLALEASFCFECNNAYGTTGNSDDVFFAFDGRSDPARVLLAKMNATILP